MKVNGMEIGSISTLSVHGMNDIVVNHNSADNSISIGRVAAIPPPPTPTTKPIFMIGLPSSTSIDHLQHTQDDLHRTLTDYHVIVLLNKTETYTAKLFSEQSTDTLDISEIKRYIDIKLK